MEESSATRNARFQIVALLYATYMSYYFARKADAITKSSLQSEAGFSLEDLAMADTFYLFTYTFALFGSGMLGARVPSRLMLFFGLTGIALVSFLKAKVSTPFQFCLLQALHAIFQSSGWPTCIKVLASVLHPSTRGTVMGFWTTCQSLGGVLGAILGTHFLTSFGSWTFAYYYHVPILLCVAVCNLFVIRDELPSSAAEETQKLNAASSDLADNKEEKIAEGESAITLHQVISLPSVLSVGCAYFFLKFLRYALLFWLPFYYETELHFARSTSSLVSTSFELGGTLGTPLIGWISDSYMHSKRDLTAGIFMFLASFTLLACIVLSTQGPWVNAFCMFLTGVLVIGPDSVLSGTIAQDIGSRSKLGKGAVGSVAGLLNSMGSMGSVFQSYATAYVSREFGWDVLFLGFVSCALVCAFILFHVSFKSSHAPTLRLWILSLSRKEKTQENNTVES